MPFTIVRNDITQMAVDAIVNTANPRPEIGLGTDSAIHQKAGPGLLEARKQIGEIAVGAAAITEAYALSARYVIHTVGPVWQNGKYNEERLLRRCFENSLQLAWEHGCSSIAFPLISCGAYGFPRQKAMQIAISVFSAFLAEHEMQIYLVVFDKQSFHLSERLFERVANYIDEHYVDAYQRSMYGASSYQFQVRKQQERRRAEQMAMQDCVGALPAAAKPLDLQTMLAREDAGFSETLLKLIDKTGKKDSEIYKKANISKQHFSKIRNNPHYKPTKATAVAFAVALELDLEATRDLIGRAGYALTNSSKFDLIIMYFLERGLYDIMQINLTLYEFDQSLLGA